MTQEDVLNRCQAGIAAWQQAFNQQDAAGCVAQYSRDATMNARPFGVFQGHEEIQQFWQNIIDQGFTNVSYSDVHWEAIGIDGYLLSAQWRMNKAFGVVHREHWVVESDGKARLISDEFEVQGEC